MTNPNLSNANNSGCFPRTTENNEIHRCLMEFLPLFFHVSDIQAGPQALVRPVGFDFKTQPTRALKFEARPGPYKAWQKALGPAGHVSNTGLDGPPQLPHVGENGNIRCGIVGDMDRSQRDGKERGNTAFTRGAECNDFQRFSGSDSTSSTPRDRP
jgi:hypothetical protein